LGSWQDFPVKIFVPLVLAVILVGDLTNKLRKPYGGYSAPPDFHRS
jgi:hypothetical protein